MFKTLILIAGLAADVLFPVKRKHVNRPVKCAAMQRILH
jgi:hypothetical protein